MFKFFPLCLLACMSGFATADPGSNLEPAVERTEEPAVEQADEVEPPPPATEGEDAPVTVAEVLTAAKKKRSQEPDLSTPSLWDRHSSEWLALLALFSLWLVARLFAQPDIEVTRRTKRHSPLTPDEFARILFRTLTSEDVETYRTMYLTGTEACQVMGNEGGATYLRKRSPEVFELAFDALFDRMPAGARYVKGHLTPYNVVELWVLDPKGLRHCIPVGHVAYIGAIMRLVDPIVGSDASPRIEHVGETDVLAPTA